MINILTAKIPHMALVSLFIHGLECLVSSIIQITSPALRWVAQEPKRASRSTESMADLDVAATKPRSAAPNLVFHIPLPFHYSHMK